jgi:hypothetical protein
VNDASSDRLAIGLVIFFIACNFAIDIAWLILHGDAAQAGPCRIAAALGLGACGPDTAVDLAREALNGTVTQILEIWLLVALLRRRPERYALQLAIASYVVYACLIDAWLSLIAALHGLPPSVATAVPSIAIAAVRGVGHLYLAWTAVLAILPRFRAEIAFARHGMPTVHRRRSRA